MNLRLTRPTMLPQQIGDFKTEAARVDRRRVAKLPSVPDSKFVRLTVNVD